MELKKCPFCGGDARAGFSGKPWQHRDGAAGYIAVKCVICGAQTKAIYIDKLADETELTNTKQGAIVINRWNTRK